MGISRYFFVVDAEGGAVILKVGGYDLIDHLHQVVRIRMFAASCMIVGLKKLFYESDKTDPGGEFFNLR